MQLLGGMLRWINMHSRRLMTLGDRRTWNNLNILSTCITEPQWTRRAYLAVCLGGKIHTFYLPIPPSFQIEVFFVFWFFLSLPNLFLWGIIKLCHPPHPPILNYTPTARNGSALQRCLCHAVVWWEPSAPAGQRMLSWPNLLLSPTLPTCDICSVTSLSLRALGEAAQCLCWAEGRWAALKIFQIFYSPPWIAIVDFRSAPSWALPPKSQIFYCPNLPSLGVWVLLNVWFYWKDGNHHTPFKNLSLSKPFPSHK